MKNAAFIFLTLIMVSCSGVKRGQKALNSGNYDHAIELAINRLQKGKDKKADQEQIVILEDAFKKIAERDLKRIDFLKRENNPANAREIYNLYTNLDNIQQGIAPLLPLYKGNNSNEARFSFNNYTNEIIEAKNNFANYLYTQSESLMRNNYKMDYRKAYHLLEELESISPNFKNSDQLQREAYAYGKDYVFVELKNRTQQIIPKHLERDLLDFNTYGLDDFWTEYHALNRRDIDYDFDINLEFREIRIAPERIIERIVEYEKEIKDGHTYQIDRNGNYVLDEDGNRIKIDRYITVKAKLYETVQSKALSVSGKVEYKDLKRQQITNSYPMQTEFIFENIFATYDGDKRALPTECLDFLNNRPVPFPSNEQMLIDASGDIKVRFSDILKRYKLR